MIRLYADHESLSRAAAELFTTETRAALKTNGRASVALSGGGTPRRTYELLAHPPYRNQVTWEKIHIFWGDERCVPPDDPKSNERMARETLLEHVPIPPEQIHPIRCEQSPVKAAEQYEKILRSHFGSCGARFDLVLLGLGENGHTASLFPGTAVLNEEKLWSADVFVAEQSLHRVTLTAPAINMASKVAFLVSGTPKASVLKEVLEGPSDPQRLPAQLIKPVDGQLIWLVDDEAGRLLSPSVPK